MPEDDEVVTDAIRVLICDDHALFRRGLIMVLESEDGIEVVAEAEDGEEAIRKAEEVAPDVVLMDVRMPRMSGIEATRAIADAVPTAKILMLTVSDEEEDLYEAVKAGATGYLLKEISIEEVANAIRAVVTGQSLISPSMASKLLSEFNNLAQAGPAEGHRPEAHRPRAPGAQARRPGHEQPGGGGDPVHLREHREEPRAQHPREAPPPLEDGSRRLRRPREAPRHPLARPLGRAAVVRRPRTRRPVASGAPWEFSIASSDPARARRSERWPAWCQTSTPSNRSWNGCPTTRSRRRPPSSVSVSTTARTSTTC